MKVLGVNFFWNTVYIARNVRFHVIKWKLQYDEEDESYESMLPGLVRRGVQQNSAQNVTSSLSAGASTPKMRGNKSPPRSNSPQITRNTNLTQGYG